MQSVHQSQVIASRHLSVATMEYLKAECLVTNVIAPFRNVHYTQYTDDTQLYIALSTDGLQCYQ